MDATASLQQEIDAATGPVTIPAGTWPVDATKGLLLRNGTHLIIDGTLQANPNDQGWSHILLAEGVRNVTIELKGQIIGDRNSHLTTTGQWGMGVMISNSKNVSLCGPGIVSQCWGDGVYVINSSNVGISGIVSERNRRNAMSVISVDGLKVFGSAFNDSGGTAPNAGIDLEPDYNSEYIRNVDICDCQFVNNAGCGVLFGFGGAPRSNFQNVKVRNCLYKGNKPISGLDSILAKAAYASLRWFPGYNWWGIQREVCI